MIITIKGADFSENKIGTLSSCTISRNLGNGTTYNGPKFIEKNSRLDATITLANGYEFGAVSITMGGSVISAHNISENILTISIGQVTGNVVINVATNWVGGEEEEPEEPVNPPATNETIELTTANGTKVSTTEIVGTVQTIGAEVYYDNSAGTKGIYTWEIPAYAEVTVTAASGGNYGIALTDTNNIVIAYVLSSAATSPYVFPVSLTPTRLHFSSTKFVSASYTILTEEDIAGMAFPISVNLQADNTKYISAAQTVGNDVALSEMSGTGYYISNPIPANATITINVKTGGSYGMVLADTNGKVLESKPSNQADGDGNITFTRQSVETLLYASKTKYNSGTYTLT